MNYLDELQCNSIINYLFVSILAIESIQFADAFKVVLPRSITSFVREDESRMAQMRKIVMVWEDKRAMEDRVIAELRGELKMNR